MSQPSAPSSSSKTPATTPSTSNFKVIFEKALKEYNKKTKQDLTAHPLATRLQACDSPAAILTILQEQVDQFKQSRSADERLHKWLDPTINVLYAFSQTLGEGVGLVFSPAKAIFAGAGVLLLAAKEVEASQEILIDIFERIENFFRRLEIHTKVPPTPAMTDMMVKIMVKVLDILGTATQEMKQSRARKFLKKMAGMGKLEGDLKKLDKMTTEEARMASAETLKITHDIDKKVDGVDEKVQGVRAGVKDVDEKVQGVDEKVQTIIDDGKEAATEAKLIMQRAVYKLDEVERRQLRESLRDWQSPPDPSTNHVIASDCQHERTTEWFCKGNIFEEWKATGSLLWIHGKPGSGKSILCSAVINNIETLHKAGLAHMAYFYFDFREVAKQSRRDLLRSLLIQLSARSDSFCDILSRLYKEHDDGTRQPTDSALMYCLKEMLTLPNQSPVYLIMDALDECPNTSGIPSARQQVLDLVMELVCLRLSSLRICATSRPEVDIRYAIEPLAFCSISIHEEVGQEKDIIEYIKSVVYSPSNTIMKQWRDEQKDMVVQTLSERADGMFRWVFCQLETLRHCLPQNVSHILRQLPATLDETYARVLKEIGKTNQNYAHRLLQCLTVTKRPLRVEELAEILALDFSAEEGIPELKENWRWKDQQEAVLSICSSLISVVGDSDHRVVQFSHFSVQEFLTSDRLANSSVDISCFHILPEPAHTVVVKASLGVLLQLRVDDAQTGHRSPLAKYAAKHWADHARFENVWTRVEDGIRRLFDSAKPHFEVWCGLIYRQLHPLQFFHYYDSNKNHGSPLYYASLCGLYDLAAHLVAENPQFLTGLVDRNPSPLVAALRNKHFDIAELLYQRGIDLGIRDDNNQTLLHAASVGGYVDTAKWLFEHGVPSKSQQRNHETPLYPTEVNGHEGYGVTVDAADDADRTPLHWASQGGYSDIARELVMRGAGVATKDQSFRTPLHLASYSGSAETVRLLIEHGADVALQDREHKTPLHLASGFLYHGGISPKQSGIVRLLIDHGADVTALDMTLSTPLHLALSSRNLEIVRILIKNGADVNAQNEIHSTPLHQAAFQADSESVRILIEHGADITARDWNHKTPLHIASSWDDEPWRHGRATHKKKFELVQISIKLVADSDVTAMKKTDLVRLLMKHGADVTTKDRTRSTPLHSASSVGSAEVVRLLIEHGADVSVKNDTQSTPLHLASSSGHADTVRLLIEHGADVTARDDAHSTPLHLASSQGNVETVRLLIEHGADVTAQDDAHSTPLHLASSQGNVETVRLLIEHGADVTAQDGNQMTPLHLASSWDGRGPMLSDNRLKLKADTVRLLIEHGADVSELQDKTHSTLLHLAAFSGNSQIVRLLLEHGAGIAALDRSHKTLLHLASSWYSSRRPPIPSLSNKKAETARLLIEHGVDVTAQDENHSTPLHLASSEGDLEIARLLIERGADVTAQDGRGETPLHLVSSWDDHYDDHYLRETSKSNVKADIVRLLIDHGADVTAQDETHSTPLHLASSIGSTEIVRLLIEHGADVTTQDKNHRTPLHLGSSWDDSNRMLSTEKKSYAKVDTVRLLIDHGADVTAQDETHLTPLHLASSFGGADTVRLLIEHGADVTALDKNHRTPLHLASSWDDSGHMLNVYPMSHAKADTVKLLIDHGADVTAQDETKSTPLHLAASFGSAETVRLLIKHGADVTAQDGNHRTPLHLASSRDEGLVDVQGQRHQEKLYRAKSDDKADTVRLLILHGADVISRDDTHSTPLHLASSKGSVETVELLIQRGADVNAQNENQSTPLHLAASSHRAVKGNIVRLLLKHGANVDAMDGEGRTPLQIASSEGHFWIAKLLSDHHAGRR